MRQSVTIGPVLIKWGCTRRFSEREATRVIGPLHRSPVAGYWMLLAGPLTIRKRAGTEAFRELQRSYEAALPLVAEWDEYGQGYDKRGELVICICGRGFPNGGWGEHLCPYSQPHDSDSEFDDWTASA